MAPREHAALRRQRVCQLAERLASAGGWADLDLAFADEAGGPTSPDRVRWAFQRVLKDTGLPRIRFHDLRRTAATLLLGRGVHPKMVEACRRGSPKVPMNPSTRSVRGVCSRLLIAPCHGRRRPRRFVVGAGGVRMG